ncbi:MAG: recombinase family protein [Lachnospiraceae bacterium]|nr:recombinase family protein [Lachnospiraceae bacterium]
MNAGYVRLSRDDDHKNYVSIENQKLIINQFAAEQGVTIDRWYEDDGISGYKFDRPGFQQLMEDLDRDVDAVYVKDFSRLGRHNAKVLLLLDEFQERRKHLIVIDDNYDSMDSDDDTISIKTWFNERYVKDTSKKIKRALGARQKEGTLITRPPFGYRRNEKDKTILEIVPKEAEVVKGIYDLYISGAGDRKISIYLTEQGKPTPSMIQRERELEEGRLSKRAVASKWSDGMVKEILDNDFYIGTFRLKKRARNTVHGKDKRVPKEEQCVFEDHHPAIIDKATFSLVQELKEKRNRTNYRGSRGQWLGSEIPNPFGSCLFCKDCGSRLTPIKRQTSSRERKYYICTTYNTKGRRYCAKAHLIEEEDLMEDVLTYIKMCRNALCEVIATYDIKDFEAEKKSLEEKRQDLYTEINDRKSQLKVLLTQKVKDLAAAAGNEELVNEAYDSLQGDLFAQIHGLEMQLKELDETSVETPDVKDKLRNALDVVDKIIAGGTLGRKDIELLIERIEVDENGMPEITLKYGLSNLITYSPAEEMNRRENTIIAIVMKLISEDNRGYTSARYLSDHITELGWKKTKQSILPYIELMKELGILESTDNPLKPYNILKSKEEIEALACKYVPNSAEMTAEELSNGYLHYFFNNRRHAGNGLRIYTEEKRH